MPLRDPATVEVIASGPPSRPHVDVGLLEIVQGGSDDTPQLTALLRERAAAAGCDAIVITNIGSRADSDCGDCGTYSRKTIAATCIAYTDKEAALNAMARLQELSRPKPPVVEGVACERVESPVRSYRCLGDLVCRDGICVADRAR